MLRGRAVVRLGLARLQALVGGGCIATACQASKLGVGGCVPRNSALAGPSAGKVPFAADAATPDELPSSSFDEPVSFNDPGAPTSDTSELEAVTVGWLGK